MTVNPSIIQATLAKASTAPDQPLQRSASSFPLENHQENHNSGHVFPRAPETFNPVPQLPAMPRIDRNNARMAKKLARRRTCTPLGDRACRRTRVGTMGSKLASSISKVYRTVSGTSILAEEIHCLLGSFSFLTVRDHVRGLLRREIPIQTMSGWGQRRLSAPSFSDLKSLSAVPPFPAMPWWIATMAARCHFRAPAAQKKFRQRIVVVHLAAPLLPGCVVVSTQAQVHRAGATRR